MKKGQKIQQGAMKWKFPFLMTDPNRIYSYLFFPYWSKKDSSQSSRNEIPHFSFQVPLSQIPTMALCQDTKSLSCSISAFLGKQILM